MLDEISGTQKVIIALLASAVVIIIFVIMIINTDNNPNKVVTLPTGVQYTITQKSTSSNIVKKGDTVSFYYTGKISDGTVFDSNVDSSPLQMVIGEGNLIKGMEDGMIGMKQDEKRTITIPPDQGYGDRDIPGIPANSTLIFDVQVTEIDR